MPTRLGADDNYLRQLRLLLEELCCDLCRFEHVKTDGLSPGAVRIDREVHLGAPGAYADIRVAPAGRAPYFVEVKYGYPDETIARHLARKYGRASEATRDAVKIVLVVDLEGRTDAAACAEAAQRALGGHLALEVWDERRLLALLRESFRVDIQAIRADALIEVRQAIDRAKGIHAFGAESPAAYEHDPLKAELLWHLGFWRLRELRETRGLNERDILPPGLYRGVAVLIGDLCSFSSYVRDTPDAEIVRQSLTAFYSKARDQVLSGGGMLYQFVGDEIVAFFGVPERTDATPRQALATARALVSIGNSVSNQWQRRIDRIQASGGIHIGMALGDLQIVSLRPFSRTHIGAIGDCINVTARLASVAGPSEIVATNSFHQSLDAAGREGFREVEPVDLRNVGRIRAWKLALEPDFLPRE